MSEGRRASEGGSERVERLRLRGDEEELFERHYDYLLRVVGAATRASHETVEDACAFAWSQLLRKQPERENVIGWLRVVAVHEVYRLLRKARGELSLAVEAGPFGELTPGDARAASDDLAGRFELQEVLAAIAALPERRRRVFELHLAGLSYREIEGLTGERSRAIERQIKKARSRLRRDFGDQAEEESL